MLPAAAAGAAAVPEADVDGHRDRAMSDADGAADTGREGVACTAVVVVDAAVVVDRDGEMNCAVVGFRLTGCVPLVNRDDPVAPSCSLRS